MIEAKIRFNFKIPELTTQQDLKKIAKRIFIPYMVKGIDDARGIDGKPFPPLEYETVMMKMDDRPLIATGELRRSFKIKKQGKYAILITLKKTREKIGEYLQIDGIRSKRGLKHFNFFGISEKMESQAMAYMRKRIREAIDRAR